MVSKLFHLQGKPGTGTGKEQNLIVFDEGFGNELLLNDPVLTRLLHQQQARLLFGFLKDTMMPDAFDQLLIEFVKEASVILAVEDLHDGKRNPD